MTYSQALLLYVYLIMGLHSDVTFREFLHFGYLDENDLWYVSSWVIHTPRGHMGIPFLLFTNTCHMIMVIIIMGFVPHHAYDSKAYLASEFQREPGKNQDKNFQNYKRRM